MAFAMAHDSLSCFGIPSRRCAVVRVVANARKRKLHHIGSAQIAAACRLEPGHCRAVSLGWWDAFQHFGACQSGLPSYVKQVFDREGQALEG